MNTSRCFDCLEDIPVTARRFVVRKSLHPDDPIPKRLASYNQSEECVCADCARWYRDAVEITEDV